jgi:predicted GNAT family acetyltransferase
MSNVISAWHLTGKKAFRKSLWDAGWGCVHFTPKDYFNMEMVQRYVKQGQTVIVPTDTLTLEALEAEGIDYDLVYPDIDSIDPMKLKLALVCSGRSLREVHDLMQTWEQDLAQLAARTHCKHIILDSGQTLIDTHGTQNEKGN